MLSLKKSQHKLQKLKKQLARREVFALKDEHPLPVELSFRLHSDSDTDAHTVCKSITEELHKITTLDEHIKELGAGKKSHSRQKDEISARCMTLEHNQTAMRKKLYDLQQNSTDATHVLEQHASQREGLVAQLRQVTTRLSMFDGFEKGVPQVRSNTQRQMQTLQKHRTQKQQQRDIAAAKTGAEAAQERALLEHDIEDIDLRLQSCQAMMCTLDSCSAEDVGFEVERLKQRATQLRQKAATLAGAEKTQQDRSEQINADVVAVQQALKQLEERRKEFQKELQLHVEEEERLSVEFRNATNECALADSSLSSFVHELVDSGHEELSQGQGTLLSEKVIFMANNGLAVPGTIMLHHEGVVFEMEHAWYHDHVKFPRRTSTDSTHSQPQPQSQSQPVRPRQPVRSNSISAAGVWSWLSSQLHLPDAPTPEEISGTNAAAAPSGDGGTEEKEDDPLTAGVLRKMNMCISFHEMVGVSVLDANNSSSPCCTLCVYVCQGFSNQYPHEKSRFRRLPSPSPTPPVLSPRSSLSPTAVQVSALNPPSELTELEEAYMTAHAGDAEDADESPSPSTQEFQLEPEDVFAEDSDILQPAAFLEVIESVPARFQMVLWRKAFSGKTDGFSLRSFYRSMKDLQPSILLIRDNTGRAFGVFATQPWHVSLKYRGTGESFVFLFHPDFRHFPWAGTDNYFQYCDPKFLSVGGGATGHALYLDSSLLHGSSGTSATYQNVPLSSSKDFLVSQLEVWVPSE